jgi:hypothetical protein
MSKTYTKSYQVQNKRLVSPHIDVTFKPGAGQELTVRFNGTNGEYVYADDLRLGEYVKITIERDKP